MQARMNQNPVMIVPGAKQALQGLRALRTSVEEQGVVPWRAIDLLQLRVSQINGCHACVEMRSYLRAHRAGANLSPDHADGKRTWEEFLPGWPVGFVERRADVAVLSGGLGIVGVLCVSATQRDQRD